MNGCIIVILNNPASFLFVDESPYSFTHNGAVFIGKFETDNNGFFDWLRVKENEVVGVRWTAYDEEDASFVADRLCGLSYVEVDNDSISIYFESKSMFDESISCDQDFGENNFYMANDGLYAFSFSAESIRSMNDFNFSFRG